jgi:hypothetical protein
MPRCESAPCQSSCISRETRRRSWRWRSVLSVEALMTLRISCLPKNSAHSYGRSTGDSLKTPLRVDCRCG